LKQEQTLILEHRHEQSDYWVMQLSAPGIGPEVRPGQFIGLQAPRLDNAVLRRPFSVYRADDKSVSILYKVVGKGTAAINRLGQGETVDIIGPLGNGFPEATPGLTPVLIGGGYGAAALQLQARTLPEKGTVFFGGRTASDILCADEFKTLGWTVEIATEDGSVGSQGLVTDVFDRWLDERSDTDIELFACGPEGMLRAFGDRAIDHHFKAWLSMDRHMACGVGACLTCVIKKNDPEKGWQWARCCKDGPVFEAREIAWDE